MDTRGKLGLKGRLSVKVIRARPTRRQRLMDYLDALKRRFSA